MFSVTKRQFANLVASGLMAAAALTSFAGATAAADKIAVGALRFTSHSASFVAFERGYFKQHGLEVEFKFFQAAQPMAVAIASGDVDFGVTAISGGLINLAEKGAVAYLFAQKGLLEVPAEGNSEDDLMLAVMDAGAEDIQDLDEVFEVLCPVEQFQAVKQALDDNGISVTQASLAWVPQSLMAVEGHQAEKIVRLLEGLEDLDDVQKVYSNFDVQEEELEKLLA